MYETYPETDAAVRFGALCVAAPGNLRVDNLLLIVAYQSEIATDLKKIDTRAPTPENINRGKESTVQNGGDGNIQAIRRQEK